MSSEKRRRARVQGGWASSANTGHTTRRSDANKPPMPVAPAWLGKNADPAPPHKYTYEEPVEDVKVKPKERVIDKVGVYDLSTTESGVSRVRLFPNFFEPKECKWMYDHLFQEIPWKQQSDTKNDVEYLQPRLTAWFGDFSYSYSGVSHAPNKELPTVVKVIKDRVENVTGLNLGRVELQFLRNNKDFVEWDCDQKSEFSQDIVIVSIGSDPRICRMRNRLTWTATLRNIKDRLEENVGLKFNSMLANLYRDGHDSVAWHSDDEPALKKQPTIASLSFGDTRIFELRKKLPPGSNAEDYAYVEHVKIPLSEGTLLIMEGATQEEWQHSIPKEYHDRSPRINLTFRVIYPE